MLIRRLRILAPIVAVAALSVALMPAFSASAGTVGNEGCTPGYWKNHLDSWEEYDRTTTVDGAFGVPGIPQAGDKLTTALAYGGGRGLDGARRILLRAATAALLNAAHDGLGFPLRRFAGPPDPSGFVPVVRSLLTGTSRDAMLAYATQLDRLNNAGCPLS